MPRTDLAVNMLLYMQKHRCIPLGIYDKKTMDAFFDHKRRQRLLFSNALRPYDTLEELAAKEHLDLKTLKATLDRYNKDIAAGVFGVTRLTACSLPDCAAFGMIAGEEIAKRARNIKA